METGKMDGEAGAKTVGGGCLWLVSTPIGNLEDMTERAVRMLREADLVACEDTRRTRKLLAHFGIEARTTRYEEHNEETKAPELVKKMEQGARVALVSDAGMPGISDPGYRLVRLCIGSEIPVIPVPGPTAVIAAVCASGLPAHDFQFIGFLPPKRKARRERLEAIRDYGATTIFFEAPHRILVALADLCEVLGERPVVVARELTKLHEEFIRGTCSQVLERLRARPKQKGEMTVMIGGASGRASERSTAPGGDAAGEVPLRQRVKELMESGSMSRMEALKTVARERGISKSQAYREHES